MVVWNFYFFFLSLLPKVKIKKRKLYNYPCMDFLSSLLCFNKCTCFVLPKKNVHVLWCRVKGQLVDLGEIGIWSILV